MDVLGVLFLLTLAFVVGVVAGVLLLIWAFCTIAASSDSPESEAAKDIEDIHRTGREARQQLREAADEAVRQAIDQALLTRR